MKITKQELIDMGACKPGFDLFVWHTKNTDAAVDVAALVGGINTYRSLMWLAGRTISRDRLFKFTRDCALLNIDSIQGYTSRKKFAEIKGWLINPVKGNALNVRKHALRAAMPAEDSCDVVAGATARAAARVAAYIAAHSAVFGHNSSRALISDSYDPAAQIAYDIAYFASAIGECEDGVNELLRQMFNEVE